jgi:hypothetical protein
MRERDNLEVPDIDRKIIIKWIFKKTEIGLWTGLMWFKTGRDGGHL